MTTYFAHPVSDYGTQFEDAALSFLGEHYPHLENPNRPVHQHGYAVRSMDYFLEDVLPTCNSCVFLSLPGAWVGSGVMMEVDHFLAREQPVMELLFVRPKGRGLRFYLSPPISNNHISANRLLTREETRGATRVLQGMPNGGRLE